MNFKRTPTTEASLIYGISLILGLLFFAVGGGWAEAFRLTQGLAVLILVPTWLLLIAAGYLTRNRVKKKFARFFVNLSVFTVISLAVMGLITYLTSNVPHSSTLSQSVAQIKATFVWVVAVYFFAATIASAITHYWFFRNDIDVKPGGELGALPQTKTSKTKKKK